MCATVRELLVVIEDSVQHLGTVDINEVDRISLAYLRSGSSLGQILNTILMCGESGRFADATVDSLREHHMCVTHLAVKWETRLFQMSHGRSPPRCSLGRPRVPINVPMVCE